MPTTTKKRTTKESPAVEPEAPVVEPIAEAADAEPKENPRTVKSREKLDTAKQLIQAELASGEWVSSNEIHRRLAGQISEGMFGRAKSALGILHRRTRGEGGKPEYQWKLPETETPAS